ncbi:MAG: TraR/DksA C4-type zinc finger protein [Actinomycetota bacterium]|nr:TraR/DksA C4-type zinc finger protein [Actinomycetota bacterium]
MSQNHAAAGLSLSQRTALQALLAGEREKTAARVAALTRDFDDIVESSAIAPPDDEHDPEGATIAFERAQVTALLAQAHRHLADLELATTRLGDGTYGVCERCGQPIAIERLLARPTAQTCIDCASAK